MRSQNSLLFLLCLLVSSSLNAAEEIDSNNATKTVADALAAGKIGAHFRYRIEDVNPQSPSQSSLASTLRSRLIYNSAAYKGFKFHMSADSVIKIGDADYTTPSAGALTTELGPKNPGQAIIADPLATDFNELYLSWSDANSKAKIGRQKIIRGNARYIGHLGWRQHEQTFDAISFEHKVVKNLSLYAAYLNRRNTITFTELAQDTLLLDMVYEIPQVGKLSVYYYDIEAASASSKLQNLGARLAGKFKKLSYAVEIAQQENSTGETPMYHLLEGGYKFEGLSVAAGIETLHSEKKTSFTTPLATLHKFNGWADQFLATPKQGLEDKYLKLAGKVAMLDLNAIYHRYDSDKGDIDFGSEINLSAGTKVGENFTLGLKYANYSAGDAASNKTDVEKYWVWAEAKF